MLTRFIILEWLRRKQNDQKTVCELFFVCCDDIRDIELSDALERLLAIFVDGLEAGTVKMEESVCKELLDWYISQPVFIQKLCCRSMTEAGIILDSHTLGKNVNSGIIMCVEQVITRIHGYIPCGKFELITYVNIFTFCR